MIAGVLLGTVCAVNAAYVGIGNAGNFADTNGYGAVNYAYKIATHEVTIAELQDSGVGSGNEGSWSAVGATAPASNISWYEAAKYCNWLTEQIGNTGVYTFDGGGNLTAVKDRATILAEGFLVYALPTEDEWYKAAYYTGSDYSLYANGTGAAPDEGTEARFGSFDSPWIVGSGAEEQNCTFDMMGNLWEWTETASGSGTNVIRGGAYNLSGAFAESSQRYVADSLSEETVMTFRPVAVPEPFSVVMLMVGGFFIAGYRRVRASLKHYS